MKILASILVLFFCCNLVLAHSCATYSRTSDEKHSQRLQKIDAIFFGEVIFVSEPMNNQDEFKHGTQKLRIKVLQAWKGVETNDISDLYTRAYTSFEKEIGGIGTKKVFYAYSRNDDPNLHIDFCSFSAFDDERMKREYGEGKVFENPQIQQIQQIENNESFWSRVWESIISFFS